MTDAEGAGQKEPKERRRAKREKDRKDKEEGSETDGAATGCPCFYAQLESLPGCPGGARPQRTARKKAVDTHRTPCLYGSLQTRPSGAELDRARHAAPLA